MCEEGDSGGEIIQLCICLRRDLIPLYNPHFVVPAL